MSRQQIVSSNAAMKDLEEKRRWPSSVQQRLDGGRYYTFEEWIQHCGGDEEAAKNLWVRASSKEMEEAYWLQKLEELKGDVDALDLVLPDQLQEAHQGKMVLQYCCSGNSLRAGDQGELEKGGAGSRAQMNLEILRISKAQGITECDVRLYCENCPCSGKYLRDNASEFDFLGAPDSEEVIFKMLFGGVLGSQAIFISMHKRSLGPFTMRWAWDPAWGQRQWHKACLDEASRLADTDPVFSGKRFHPIDASKTCFTFPEWMLFIVEHGWGGPFSHGAEALAMHVWLKESFDPDDAWLHIDAIDDCMHVDT